MDIYKFTAKNHVNDALNGRFRLGSARQYRFFEVVSQIKNIGDANEGVAVENLGEIPLDGKTQDDYRKLEKLKFSGTQEALDKVEIGCAKKYHFEDAFILSFSMGNFESLCDFMIGREDFSYDACVKIGSSEHIHQFINEGTFEAKLNGKNFSGNISEYFEVFFGPVVYAKSGELQVGEKFCGVDFFCKKYEFEYQKEFRVILKPKIEHEKILIENEFIFININNQNSSPEELSVSKSNNVINNFNNSVPKTHQDLYRIVKKYKEDLSKISENVFKKYKEKDDFNYQKIQSEIDLNYFNFKSKFIKEELKEVFNIYKSIKLFPTCYNIDREIVSSYVANDGITVKNLDNLIFFLSKYLREANIGIC